MKKAISYEFDYVIDKSCDVFDTYTSKKTDIIEAIQDFLTQLSNRYDVYDIDPEIKVNYDDGTSSFIPIEFSDNDYAATDIMYDNKSISFCEVKKLY